MDYLFFQAAAVNGFDSFGHYLRAGLIVNQCSTYAVAADGRLLGELPPAPERRPRPPRRCRATRCSPGRRACSRGSTGRRRRERRSARPPSGAAARREQRGRATRRAPEARRQPTRAGAEPAPAPARRPGADGRAPAPRDAGEATRAAAARLPVRGRRLMSGRGSGIAGNPVLIGAATVLVVARRRVPRPTTPTRACRSSPPTRSRREAPSAANLVRGNEVRIGGTRVGSVDSIERRAPRRRHEHRRARPQARAVGRAAAEGLDGDRSGRARRSA